MKRESQKELKAPIGSMVNTTELMHTPMQMIDTMIEGATSHATLSIPADICYAHFNSISDVHDFARRAAVKSGKQGSVKDLGDYVIVDVRPEIK
jgi:hypothetical protein